MAIADYWLEQDVLSCGDVCYHIIPMSNPDGVTISQTGTLNGMQQQIHRSDLQKGYTSQTETAYAAGWKANGEGVDPNKNFPAGWELIDDRSEPSSEQYQGTEPFSAAEAAALRDYTLKYDFDTTIGKYQAFVDYVFGFQPDAIVYVCANMHVNSLRNELDDIHNNAAINRMNEQISQFADNEKIFYLDVNPLFDDENGNLAQEYVSDDTHLMGMYYEMWCNWYCENTLAVPDC
jgi:hypothetical protein